MTPESLEAFNEASAQSFSSQAIFFLNAFWEEHGDQAEFIYSHSWRLMKQADMNAKGISYIHLYEEGNDLDFDLGLYFFEQLCKFTDDGKNAAVCQEYEPSMPVMMTSIVRKKELREKVDVNFDGRVGFLEYLLYQYKASPKDLMARSMSAPDEDEAIRKAREALERVNKAIKEYETEKHRLETLAESGRGIKALKAKNELAQLNSSPLWETLNKALITAEAAVRIATRNARKNGGKVGGKGEASGGRSDGAVWWMNRDIKEKKSKYGPRS